MKSKKGNGFKDIEGMEELKSILQEEVVYLFTFLTEPNPLGLMKTTHHILMF